MVLIEEVWSVGGGVSRTIMMVNRIPRIMMASSRNVHVHSPAGDIYEEVENQTRKETKSKVRAKTKMLLGQPQALSSSLSQ